MVHKFVYNKQDLHVNIQIKLSRAYLAMCIQLQMAHDYLNRSIIHTASVPFWYIIGTFIYGQAHTSLKHVK